MSGAEIGTYAFKLFEKLDQRLDRIEVLLGRLVDAKDDREDAAALAADVEQQTAKLQGAIPPTT